MVARFGAVFIALLAIVPLIVLSGNGASHRTSAGVVIPNDNLGSALEIAFQPYTNVQSTVGATTDGVEGVNFINCQGDSSGAGVGATVWYKYTHGGANTTLQLDTIASNFNTVIAVYSGPAVSPTHGALTYITCGDNEWGAVVSGLTFSAVSGQTYYFQVGGYFGFTGNLVLNLSPIVSTAGLRFTVNSTADTGDATPDGACDNGVGACTFREALAETGAAAGTDNIWFGIGSGAVTIAPASSYGYFGDVVVDARTQPGFTGAPLVVLDGVGASCSSPTGLPLAFSAASVRGFVIERFCHTGISFWSNNNVVQGNYVGLHIDGVTDLGQSFGLYVLGGTAGNVIGGTTAAARNVISGNGLGVYLDGGSIANNNNVVLGNFIGTNAAGTGDVGSDTSGILINGSAGATGNVIGGSIAGARNVISGNADDGVLISGANATANTVAGNLIGTNATGGGAIPNDDHGVRIEFGADNNIIGGATAAARNVISGNAQNGVLITGATTTLNSVQGNYIGTDAAGAADLGNGASGVAVVNSPQNTIGGTATTAGTAPGNVVSGNVHGIVISGDDSDSNLVLGNLVGLTAAGSTALGNADVGVWILSQADNNTIGGTAATSRNVISGNGRGIAMFDFGTSGNIARGNYVGTNLAGTADIANTNGLDIGYGASGNTVGGIAAGAGNLLSGNGNHGLSIGEGFATNSNVVQGNYIGTTANGTGTLGNNGHGVVVTNGSSGNTIGPGNVISSNVVHGVKLEGAGANTVKGNYIGTNSAGTAAVANGFDGVAIVSSVGNVIGGTVAADRNVISGNIGDGVSVENSGGPGGYSSTDVPKTFGLSPTTTTSVINVPDAGTVADVNVTLDIAHTWDSDVQIYLTPPGGSPIPLALELGGNGDHYQATIFDDEAATSILSGVPPFNGTFRPQSPLSQADGMAMNGNWTLTLTDVFPAADDGTLNSWSLSLTAVSNRILGNYIGTDAAGTAAIGNGTGVFVDQTFGTVVGGSTAGAGNLISGNAGHGVWLRGADTAASQVQGNLIGTAAGGVVGLGNSFEGVQIEGAPGNTIGGTALGARNVISANGGQGVRIISAGSMFNAVMGNYIGTNTAGSADLGNNGNGIFVSINASRNTIGGSLGTTPGGACTGACNLISGNNQTGIQVFNSTSNTTVQGNFIGTNAAGTAAIGNSVWGVLFPAAINNLVGGPAPGQGNLISGNPGGIALGQGSNTVQGNLIGTQTNGTSPLGNGIGLVVYGTSAGANLIGGINPGEGNTIAFNNGIGVSVDPLGGNPLNTAIVHNRIFANAGLGIDLNVDGVTANDPADPDTGPNNLQNYPFLTLSTVGGGSTTVTGSLNSNASTSFTIEFFQTYACDASGQGEGQTFLGSFPVVTDAAGNVNFAPSLGVEAGLGSFITATATGSFGTSEFSNCIPAVDDADDDNDGYTEVAEAGTPLCSNAIDDDSDGTTNDGCPAGPAQVGPFSEAQFKIGTDPRDPCGGNGWPSDLDGQPASFNELDIFDLTSFLGPVRRLDKNPGQTGFDSRWDLTPGKGGLGTFLNILDITTLLGGTTGNPPMFGNTRAFGKTCPFPP